MKTNASIRCCSNLPSLPAPSSLGCLLLELAEDETQPRDALRECIARTAVDAHDVLVLRELEHLGPPAGLPVIESQVEHDHIVLVHELDRVDESVLSHTDLDLCDSAGLIVDLFLFEGPVTLNCILRLIQRTGKPIREVKLNACEREVASKLPLVADLGQLYFVIVIKLDHVFC